MVQPLPTFAELNERFGAWLCGLEQGATDILEDEKPKIVEYLRSLGVQAETTDQLLQAVGALADEEELSAFACREGVAVTHASEGWWVLFERDDPALSAEGDAR